jgi:hypothetical protein
LSPLGDQHLKSVAPNPPIPLTLSRSWEPTILCWTLTMKTERLAAHHEARKALVLSVASVTAIMLTAYLLLLILY